LSSSEVCRRFLELCECRRWSYHFAFVDADHASSIFQEVFGYGREGSGQSRVCPAQCNVISDAGTKARVASSRIVADEGSCAPNAWTMDREAKEEPANGVTLNDAFCGSDAFRGGVHLVPQIAIMLVKHANHRDEALELWKRIKLFQDCSAANAVEGILDIDL
jgi:hypothetical protein